MIDHDFNSNKNQRKISCYTKNTNTYSNHTKNYTRLMVKVSAVTILTIAMVILIVKVRVYQ